MKTNEWTVLHSSAIGRQHLTGMDPKPCQDANVVRVINDSWGIAAVCDGAGSAANSHFGSRFVADKLSEYAEKMIIENGWIGEKRLPGEEDFRSEIIRALKHVKDDLTQFAAEKEYELETLACTVILVIYSPLGLLTVHIGDGRAGYCDENGEWEALMIPMKGEEANMTVFFTSEIWDDTNQYIETRIVDKPVRGFTLMSDGCEKHAFQCGIFDETEQKYIAQNKPHGPFFDPLIAALQSMQTKGETLEEIAEKWKVFVEKGTTGLEKENDDKTLILGFIS